MLNLAPEVLQFHRQGTIADEAAGPLIAAERREIVSIYAEVRGLAWVGMMLIAGGVGVIVSKNLERIGPIVIAAAIGIAAAACYAFAVWRRVSKRQGVLDDYVLLLGALILSADAGYIEHQFHVLGSEWPRHFLLLAIVHGVTAYAFDSPALLSLSIAALASWLGIERNIDTFFTDKIATAMRAYVCAAIVAGWRAVDVSFRAPQSARNPGGGSAPPPRFLAVSAARNDASFARVFDHFILNLALWGGLIVTFNSDTRIIGALLVIVLAVLTIAYGFRKREEAFVLYGYVYGVIAIETVLLLAMHDLVLGVMLFMLSMGFAVAGLYLLHDRFKRSRA